MIITFLSFYFFLSLFSLFKIKDRLLIRLLLFYFFSTLLIFIFFRDGNRCPDYVTYQYFYNNIENTTYGIESSLKYIIKFLHFFNFTDISLFIVYGLLGFGIKFSLIKKDRAPFIALLGYLCYEMPNQEMTAIRAGVATAFLLLAIYSYSNSKIKFYFFGLLAFLFHYSAFLFIVYPFCIRFSSKKWLWRLLLLSIILPFIIQPFMIKMLNMINNPFLNAKLMQYSVNVNYIKSTFRAAALLRYLIFIIFIYKIKLIRRYNQKINLELLVLMLGILMNSIFSFSPIFQYRTSSLFYSIEIFMYKNFIYIFKNKTVGKLFILLLCGFNLFYLLFGIKLFGGF